MERGGDKDKKKPTRRYAVWMREAIFSPKVRPRVLELEYL